MEFKMNQKRKSQDKPIELLPHIFFPRKLPTGATRAGIVDEDACLLNLMTSTVEGLQHCDLEGLSKPILKTVKLFSTWNSIQLEEGFNVAHLLREIKSLKHGDSMAMYFRAQNAGLILSIPCDGKHTTGEAVISAFSASQSCNTVMGADGSVSSIFPGCSYHVPSSILLKSDALAVHLSSLSERREELAMPQVEKSGSWHQEVRDVADPVYITQWLPALLSAKTSDMCQHFRPVCKKIRDNVVIGESTLPFRRSGLWMTAKVVLHLSLIKEIKNEVQATILYKLIMIKLMTTCANSWKENLNADLGMQVIGKIARRIVKLQEYVTENQNNVPSKLWKYFEFITTEGQNAVLDVSGRLDRQWKTYVSTKTMESNIKYNTPLDFQVDTIHQLSNLTAYLETLKQQLKTSKESESAKLPCPPRHTNAPSRLFPVDNFETVGEEFLGIVLTDFELSIENLESYNNCMDVVMLRKLFDTYSIKAKNYYKEDPVGHSRMILTQMNMLMVTDKFTLKKYPLLAEYSSGIDVDIIQELLLPSRKEMELALTIENYFAKRNHDAIYPSLIEDASISSTSFSVRFASENQEMLSMKERIESDCEVNQNDKKESVIKMQKICADLRKKNSKKVHDYYTDRYGIKSHHWICERCMSENSERKMSVSIYEKLLPESDVQKHGVVFELLIPSEISCLRDMLFKFHATISGETRSNNSAGFWTSHLSQYQKNSAAAPNYVKFGSSTKLFASTHWSRNNPHPDSSLDSFIVNNGFNCKYFYDENSSLPPIAIRDSIRRFCTFTVDSNTPYKELQFALDGTSHTQNEVMARQVDCPVELRLAEFIEFGSLRAGHRLQWHNIHRAIVQGTLSLETESVFSLICQTIWQAGPKINSNNNSWRESDAAILDPKFAAKTLELLNTELEKNSKNWTNSYFLAVVVVLTTRIASLTEDSNVKDTAFQLLRKSRKVAEDWCKNIENLLSNMTTAPRKDVHEMRTRLVQIAALSALTFSMNQQDMNSAIRDPSDIQSWLRSVAKIHDNILLTESSLAEMPMLLRNLLRSVLRVGVGMANYFRTLNFVKDGVEAFVNEQLPKEVTIIAHSYEDQSKQVFQCSSKDSGFQMDLITGRFYVKGKPVGKLPYSISSHPDFQRVFSGTILEVREVDGTAPGSLTTVLKFNKCVYNFHLREKTTLLVTEIHENGDEYQLVSHSKLVGDIPYLLIHKFSHWKNAKTDVIYFRPIDFQDPNFMDFENTECTSLNVEYKLNYRSKELTQMKTGWRVVDVNSETYQNLSDILKRLENPDQILIFSDNNQIIAELPRMALQFQVDKSNVIHSKEYNGMRIAKSQGISTLVGLQNGILLKSTQFNDITMAPILLINHGGVTISSSEDTVHHMVNISTETLGTPAYFAFEVDTRLRRLRAGQSRAGWLYLAYLHAVTASPIPDPFTGMTGTEAALQLLQSPLCWSCEPLDQAATTILQWISQLSPERVFYPSHLEVMERANYPEVLTSAATQDSFRIIVEKIVADSRRLSFLYPSITVGTKKAEPPEQMLNEKLCLKAYRRHVPLTNEQCRIQEGYLALPAESEVKLLSSAKTHLDWQEMTEVRKLAQLCSTWEYSTPEDSSILTELLGCLDKLKVKLPSDSDHTEEEQMEAESNESKFHLNAASYQSRFPDSWFELYDLARLAAR